jgi:hypothetical protein
MVSSTTQSRPRDVKHFFVTVRAAEKSPDREFNFPHYHCVGKCVLERTICEDVSTVGVYVITFAGGKLSSPKELTAILCNY